jgi:uncharacterized protein YcfJ
MIKTPTKTPRGRPSGGRLLASAGLTLATLVGCAAPYQAPVTVRSPTPVYEYPTQPQTLRDYRRRSQELLYEAQVMTVRAVMGSPQQRCWLEREEVVQPRQNNLPGAVVGGIIGGILGHQIGGGSGRDLATVGGAVAGAAIGSNAGGARGPDVVTSQDVQRCTSVPGSAVPIYWDVTYVFQGLTHRVQMTDPPGRTVTVNAQGEPRI